MRKYLYGLFIAMLLFAGVFFTRSIYATTELNGTVAVSELYMRKGAGTDYDRVEAGGSPVVLTEGQEIVVLDATGDWYKVRAVYNGNVVEGYCLGHKDDYDWIKLETSVQNQDVESGKTDSGKTDTGKSGESSKTDTDKKTQDDAEKSVTPGRIGKVTAKELNVRKGPGTNYDKVPFGKETVVFTTGQKVTILDEKDGWYHVKAIYGGYETEGYCLGTYIEITEGEAAEYAYGKVNATELNIRTGASTDFDKLVSGDTAVTLKKGAEVIIIEQDGEWYHVYAAFGGKTIEGYCMSKYITLTEGIPVQKEETIAPDEKTEDTGKGEGTDKDEEAEKPYEPINATDFSHGVPEGYEIATKAFNAKFDFKGYVAPVSGLNLRKSASSGADVIAVLEQGKEVRVIKSTVVSTAQENGESVSVRWFKVVVDLNGEFTLGYVQSEYISLDCTTPIAATTKYSKQILRKTAKDGAKRLRDADGKLIRLSKGTEVSIIGGKTGSDGVYYYLAEVTYKEHTYTGYIAALRLAYTSNAEKVHFEYLVKSESSKTDSDPLAEENLYSFEGANAHIKGSAGLTVHAAAANASDMVYTEEKIPVLLFNGDSVEILDSTADNDSIWYHIRFYYKEKEYFGYIRSNYVDADESITLMGGDVGANASPLSFEAMLDKEGFPESYRVFLRELHAAYPAWQFRAYQTGLDWNEVIANESEVGKNLIPNTKSLEWLSFEPGAYSWKTDSFVVFDGSTWVTASEDAARYYMDPRNFLNEKNIFQFEVLEYTPDYQTLEGVANILSNTALSNRLYSYIDETGVTRTLSYEETFIMAAEYTGVNPLHLASRVKQEVVKGTNELSNSVSATVAGYEGLYNFYNIGAYHSTEAGGAIKNGLKFALNGSSSISLNTKCLIPWVNPFKAILGGAYYIGNNYINRGQNTIYLQKFNVTGTNTYAHQYMANIEAPYSEGAKVYRGYSEPENLPVVFSIPVYENMPEEPSPVPTKKYNPNNWLKTMKVYDQDGNKLKLTPSFDYTEDTEYSLIVDWNVNKLKIKTTTVSTLAKVISDKYFELEYGLNKVIVQVCAENGDIRDYVINVIREDAPEEIKEAQSGESTPEDAGEGTTEETGEGTTKETGESTTEETGEGTEAEAAESTVGNADESQDAEAQSGESTTEEAGESVTEETGDGTEAAESTAGNADESPDAEAQSGESVTEETDEGTEAEAAESK